MTGTSRLRAVDGKKSRPTADDREAVRRQLAETLLFLQGQHARLEALTGGGFYASTMRLWVTFLETALGRAA